MKTNPKSEAEAAIAELQGCFDRCRELDIGENEPNGPVAISQFVVSALYNCTLRLSIVIHESAKLIAASSHRMSEVEAQVERDRSKHKEGCEYLINSIDTMGFCDCGAVRKERQARQQRERPE